MNELCVAYEVPFFDLATEIHVENNSNNYGGRVFFTDSPDGCLHCYDLLDLEDEDFENLNFSEDIQDIYGLDKNDFKETGPSVISINGIIASFAVTEFIMWATNMQKPKTVLTYRGKQSIVTINNERQNSDWYYCNDIRGKQQASGVYRFLE